METKIGTEQLPMVSSARPVLEMDDYSSSVG